MAQDGFLTARIYTSRGQIPIEDAIVTVLSDDKSTQNIIAKRTTDKNGQIAPVTISAPDETLSLEPGDRKVFSTVDVRVDKSGFYTFIVKNVQIFANQTTVVDSPIIPLPDNQEYNDRADEFVETPQNL